MNKTKIVVIYITGEEKIVYDGEFNAKAMRLQADWVLKARKNKNIRAVVWR